MFTEGFFFYLGFFLRLDYQKWNYGVKDYSILFSGVN